MLLAIAVSWIAAVVLARVGIPRVDPSLEQVPRPLESLGTIAVCLPASLHASLLHDQAAYLVSVSPRSSSRLRAGWLLTVLATGCVGGALWSLLLPPAVPRIHAFALWILVLNCAIAAVTFVRFDLSIAFPLALMLVFSIRGIVPFNHNPVYNVALTGHLIAHAACALTCAATCFTTRGDHRDRDIS